MALLFLKSGNLEQFLTLLRQHGELHGPLRGEDGMVRFAPLPPGRLPDTAAPRTVLPPRKYLLHPRETLLTYQSGSGYQQPTLAVKPLFLLGLHPCDLAAIGYLDRLFLAGEPDPLYAARRAALTMIGSSCTADDFCSCQRRPSPLPVSCDLFLQQLDGGFAVSSGSTRGEQLRKLLAPLLEERNTSALRDNRRFFGAPPPPPGTAVEPDPSLPDWQELADHCLGCGACSICCPTCSCFDVLEFGGLDNSSAERVRSWDNCLFKSHAEVAGGTSFRKDRAERFRYRYIHKYQGFGRLHGVSGCVGCGRCRAFCPAGLDLRPLAERLERDRP